MICEGKTPANLFTDGKPSTVTRQFACTQCNAFHFSFDHSASEPPEDCSSGCPLGSQSPEQVNATEVPSRSKLKTLITGANQLDSTNVLSPRSVHCTFLYPRCSIEDPKNKDCGAVVTRNQNDSQSACRHHTPTFRPSLLAPQLWFQLSFLSACFLSRQCVSCTNCSPFASVQVCCTRATPKRSIPVIIKHPAQMDCSRLNCDLPKSENKHPWTEETDCPQLSHMLANWFAPPVVELSCMKQWHTAREYRHLP